MYIHYYFTRGICLCTCITYHCRELTSIWCPSLFWVGPRESMWEPWRSAGLSPESHAAEVADLLHGSPANSFWSAKNKKREITQAEYNSARYCSSDPLHLKWTGWHTSRPSVHLSIPPLCMSKIQAVCRLPLSSGSRRDDAEEESLQVWTWHVLLFQPPSTPLWSLTSQKCNAGRLVLEVAGESAC